MPLQRFIRKSLRAFRPAFNRSGFLAAVFSGILLTVSFAPFEWAWAAWVALVPLLWVVAGIGRRSAVQLAALAGVVHWGTSIWWVGKVTVTGTVALVLYCSLYFIAPVWLARSWSRRRGWESPRIFAAGSLLVASGWTSAEWLRGSLFTGFPWNPLGASQVDWTAFIGVADLGGVYLLTFLVAWGNVLLVAVIRCRKPLAAAPTLAAFFTVLTLVLVYGASRSGDADTPPVKVGLVQPNIPQHAKWEPALNDRILDTIQRQTVALAEEGADLVVWPETAMPNYVLVDRQGLAYVRNLLQEGAPLLVGSMHAERTAVDAATYYNSSLLFLTDGALADRYDKQHLVLVGEYIPFETILLGIFQAFTPMQENVTAGRETDVMHVAGTAFAPLICFEDILPYLSRRAAHAGARWLVNQTNDGWFDGTPGARQHFRLARLRCVEHRMPMVRATNSGVTALVGADGEIREVLTDSQGRMRPVEGRLLVPVHPGAGGLTWYARGGHVFPFLTLLLAWVIGPWMVRRSSENGRR